MHTITAIVVFLLTSVVASQLTTSNSTNANVIDVNATASSDGKLLPAKNYEMQFDASKSTKIFTDDRNTPIPQWMLIGGVLTGGLIAGFVFGIVCVACCCKSVKGEGLVVSGGEKESMLFKPNQLPFKNDLEKRLQYRRQSSQCSDLSQKKVNVPMSPAYPSPSPVHSSVSEVKSKRAMAKKNDVPQDTVTESVKHSI